MLPMYPNLIGEISKRGIKRKVIAERLHICDRTLRKKIRGESSFTWEEVLIIRNCFFPDLTPEELFSRSSNQVS